MVDNTTDCTVLPSTASNDRAFVPFALPDISESEVAAVAEVLRSGWITTGPKTREFTEKFATKIGAREVVMVNSCTAALHLALEALGIREGDEVIVPSVTFAATAEVVRYLGAIPVLVDIRSDDHNLDVEAFERAITPKTRAVMPVHFAGMPCDMDEVTEIARRRNIYVVDDAAHCFPCQYKNRNVGCLGDITAFSFYATKTITTAEGGAIATNNPEWAARMRIMSLHGISRDVWNRYASDGSWYYEIAAPGFKYNLTDVASALGLGQLARADSMLSCRRSIAQQYDAAFRNIPALELIDPKPDRGHAHHLYVIKLRPGALSINRSRFIDELKLRHIGASVHFIPLHLHPYYRDNFGYLPQSLPVALSVYERSISIPIYSKMGDGDVSRVIEAVVDITRKFQR